MGLGVAAMHYTGMQAMQMSPAINYDPSLFAASIVIAVTASFAALKLAFHLRGNAFGVAILSKIGSAVLMGIAITGMHYTGMAAAQFAPGSRSEEHTSELQSLMRISYAVLCLKKKNNTHPESI